MYPFLLSQSISFIRTIEIDAKKVGELAALETAGGATYGAKIGRHAGIVSGRNFGIKGTIVFGTLGGLTGFVVGAAVGTAASVIKNHD